MKNGLTEIRHDNSITLARYDYTALEINLMTLIFEQVNSYGESDYVTYKLDLTILYKLTGFDRSHLSRIKEALKSIRYKFFEFYDKEEMIYTNTVLISSFQIYENKDVVLFSIDPFMRPLLFNIIKSTTRYYRESILSIPGKNSKRIYHLCSMFKNRKMGKEYEFKVPYESAENGIQYYDLKTDKGFTIEVNRLKSRLHIDTDKYDEGFYMFELRVLKPAIEQINQFTDLYVGYEKIKEGRIVTELKFLVLTKENKRDQEITAIESEDARKVFRTLTEEFLIPGHMAENALVILGIEKLRKIIYDARLKTDLRNKGAYIAVTLEHMGVSRTKLSNEQRDITDDGGNS